MNRFTKIGSKGQHLADDAKKWVAVLDNTTRLMWSADDVGGGVKHAGAENAVASLSLAGFSDWRLPTVEELFPLAERSRCRPAIDTTFFPTCKSDWYWTSTPWAPSPAGYAWVVAFDHGDSYGHYRDYNARVRAVRSVAGAGQ